MKCQSVQSLIHEYLDNRLNPREAASASQHLDQCIECRSVYDELCQIRGALAMRLHLPEASRNRLWKKVRIRRHRLWISRLTETFDNARTYLRDLERPMIWTRLTALPVTLLFFLLILAQFPRPEIHEWAYPVIGPFQVLPGEDPEPVISQLQVRQSSSQLSPLVNTLWGMPFEDSLALVALITPEGSLQINDVLRYPRSWDLLHAVDMNLRSSRFEKSNKRSSYYVIYSFQKIDVYEDHRGL